MPNDFERTPPPEPQVIRTILPGQAVLWCGKRMVVALYHPFRGLRLQAPSGGPTFYASRADCEFIDEESPTEPGNGVAPTAPPRSGRT